MWVSISLIAMTAATAALPCVLPPDTPSNNIPEGFAIQVQNSSFPVIHNRLMNQWVAGGGDQHLYLSPVGNPAGDLTLVDGVITQSNSGKTIRAVINGEYTAFDNTTKMFMTERGDPRAVYDVAYGCNPDTDAVQTQLVFKERAGAAAGGHICVRLASGNRYEFRYSPPGNTAVDDPARQCIQVTLAVVRR
ncbi:hypothetical protein NOR_04347 [Metarhizium rileyi]|uniref:DUF7909 domain-containing protein n=1 Tax=Metarhizium rileyi (strain RCEF 4871) TaxID=1649241 RepID=A0A167EE96_METRR|nr:hypothetical protein NOR_04347 [Metarhizium rileyi RCEF 4871]TWU78631.1 hypothetical protein ED733_005276 [Metarhizium rileyi]